MLRFIGRDLFFMRGKFLRVCFCACNVWSVYVHDRYLPTHHSYPSITGYIPTKNEQHQKILYKTPFIFIYP